MKKYIALFLAVLMLFSLAACAAKPAAEAAKPAAEAAKPAAEAAKPAEEAAPAAEGRRYEGVELNFWWPPFGEDKELSYWSERFAAWEEETGAKVNITVVSWEDLSPKLITGFMSDDAPDVFYMTTGPAYDLHDAGALLNLADYFTAEEKAEQLYWTSGYAISEDEVYSIPVYGGADCRTMFYNMDLLNSVGVTEAPETWEDLVDAALKLKEANACEYPLLYPVDDGEASPVDTFITLLYNAGGSFTTDDLSTPTLDSPESLQVCQFLYDLANKYEVLSKDAVTYSEQRVYELFAEGKVAMASNGPGILMDTDFDFEIDTKVLAPEGKNPMTFSAYDALAINAKTKNLDASLELYKLVVGTEGREDFRANFCPSVAALNAGMEPTEYPYECISEVVSTISEHGKPIPVGKGGGGFTEIMKSVEQLLVLDEITPEEAVVSLQEGALAAMEG